MEVSAHRRAHAGELVAYDLPPGERWVEIVASHAESGASFLPIDHRLSAREKRRLVELARPTTLVTLEEEIVFPQGVELDPARAWAVVATSGTGGAPRLADLPRAALGSAVAGSLDSLGIGAGEPWVCALTPAHVGGLLVVLRGVLGGAPLVVHERFDLDRVLAETPPGFHLSLAPTMLHRMVSTGLGLGSFGILLVGGAALDPDLRRRAEALGGRVVSTYGLTESCGGVVYDGRPFAGTELRLDPDGRIELRGPTVMDGYRGDARATAGAFTTDGWLRTGDVGALDAGRLTVRGRSDDAIRTGAETVWPDEVETALRTHPQVADVAVAGVPDQEWGMRVAAWVVPVDATDPPSLDDLRVHCRDLVAGFKAPRELRVVERLPRTPDGKVRRGALDPHHG